MVHQSLYGILELCFPANYAHHIYLCSDISETLEYFSIHLLACQDPDRHTYTDLNEHTLWAEFHAYGAVIVCPSPSIIDYYPLIRLISYLRNLL